MRRIAPEDVDAFGNALAPEQPAQPRAIRAELDDVPTEHLHAFVDALAEAEERFEAYRTGVASLEMMASAAGARAYYLAQDQVNTWLRRQIVAELARRGTRR